LFAPQSCINTWNHIEMMSIICPNNKHMWSKIYLGIYHDIVHIANEGFILEYVLFIINLNQCSPKRRSGWLFHPGFNEIALYQPQGYVFVAPSAFGSYFFTNNHTFSSIFTHVPEIWPIQGLIFNILFQTCWLHLS